MEYIDPLTLFVSTNRHRKLTPFKKVKQTRFCGGFFIYHMNLHKSSTMCGARGWLLILYYFTRGQYDLQINISVNSVTDSRQITVAVNLGWPKDIVPCYFRLPCVIVRDKIITLT